MSISDRFWKFLKLNHAAFRRMSACTLSFLVFLKFYRVCQLVWWWQIIVILYANICRLMQKTCRVTIYNFSNADVCRQIIFMTMKPVLATFFPSDCFGVCSVWAIILWTIFAYIVLNRLLKPLNWIINQPYIFNADLYKRTMPFNLLELKLGEVN